MKERIDLIAEGVIFWLSSAYDRYGKPVRLPDGSPINATEIAKIIEDTLEKGGKPDHDSSH